MDTKISLYNGKNIFDICSNQFQIAQVNYTKRWTQTPILLTSVVPMPVLQLNAFCLVEVFM